MSNQDRGGTRHEHDPPSSPTSSRALPRDPGRLEARRMTAAELFETGVRQAEIARQLGVSHQTVSRWHARWLAGGRGALAAGTTGRRSRLGPEHLAEIEAALRRPPGASGLPGSAWTVRSARQLIARVAGVDYHPSQVWRILRQLDNERAAASGLASGGPAPASHGPGPDGPAR